MSEILECFFNRNQNGCVCKSKKPSLHADVEDSHEICLICYFGKKQQNLKLLSVAKYRSPGALWVKYHTVFFQTFEKNAQSLSSAAVVIAL